MLRYAERKGQAMAYRFGNREQLGLLPSSIEEYVSAEDPVRVYDAFVESLNFTELGIEVDEDQVGNPEYDPKAMMKLLVYGYSYGVKGSRSSYGVRSLLLLFCCVVAGSTFNDHTPFTDFPHQV